MTWQVTKSFYRLTPTQVATLILPTLFVTACIHLLQLYGSLTTPMVVCASPFALWKQLRWSSILSQPFYLDNVWNALSFAIILTSLALFQVPKHDDIQKPRRMSFTAYPSKQALQYINAVILPMKLYVVQLVVRTILGYCFFRGTGFAYPRYFFNSSLYDCSPGLQTIYLSWIITTCYFTVLDDRLIMAEEYFTHYTTNKLSISSYFLSYSFPRFISCLVCFWITDVSVWSVLSSLLAAVIVCCIGTVHRSRTRLTIQSSTFISAFAHASTIFAFLFSLVILLFSFTRFLSVFPLLTNSTTLPNTDATSMSADTLYNQFPILLSLVVITAPRINEPKYLLKTIDSLIGIYPRTMTDQLYSRVSISVYTEFTAFQHPVFTHAFLTTDTETVNFIQYGKLLKEENDLVIYTEEDTGRNQAKHFSNAIKYALEENLAFIMLIEDDFPLCQGAWPLLLSIMKRAYAPFPRLEDGPCGVFVGSGGSGLIIRRDIARIVSRILLTYSALPTDIIIQDCLRGKLQECAICLPRDGVGGQRHEGALVGGGGLVVGQRMIMRHVGFNASTFDDREYYEGDFQCGWRHPLNGESDVTVLSIS